MDHINNLRSDFTSFGIMFHYSLSSQLIRFIAHGERQINSPSIIYYIRTDATAAECIASFTRKQTDNSISWKIFLT